ncbi:Activated Cdc42 kinase-like [Frankliniella fusca]|uniref:non-specific protein-tyrosine kinase n=1 Tax=Frankliniella fusca TaxID=407009 RepID=A0AAE1LAL1_9NEOP|nr:Activated Cdc42 kinase-like [Frankliniella fusca]
MATARGPGLYEFLIEAELQQYYSGIKNDLKVQNVSQLKYVTEEDLQQIGMTKPEMRRLKKFFQRHFPQNYISKLKKMIRPKKEEQCSMQSLLPDDNQEKPAIRVPNKHIIPAEAILVNKELGAGEFGVVQQGVWTNDRDRIQVAIKCLSRERMQNNPIEFLKEAAIMHAIDHEHIVRLYGVVLDTSALMLVTELAPLRSLLECLKEPSLRASFPVLSLCDFAIQVCDGMQYLETKRLIHRDLAARNILVFSKNKVKISDFGLSRALGVGKDYYQTNFNVNLKLPIAWCAPECISYLRFTSASDVWAYGVTLWEMFSYGFQPWAALTGHQILEAIDEPNFQRLEQPECCPKEYFSVMLRCWQHDPAKRPRFCDLMDVLPECKPEQVQVVDALVEGQLRREQLLYRVADIITVLDKSPIPNVTNVWKGVLSNGKTGLFNPAHTVAYIGNNLPASNKPGDFARGDGRNTFSSRRRLRPEMISRPQGDLQHCGHVGKDGAFFGDISFLGGKQYSQLPRQVVTPYKPQEDAGCDAADVTDRAPLLKSHGHPQGDVSWSDFPDAEDVPPMSKHLAKYSPPRITQPSYNPAPSNLQSLNYGPSLSSSPPASNLHQNNVSVASHGKPDQLGSQQASYTSSVNGIQNGGQYGPHHTSHHRLNGNSIRSSNGAHNGLSGTHNGLLNGASSKSHSSGKSHNGAHGGQGRSNMDHEYHEISDEEEAACLEKTFELGSLLTEMESAFPSLGTSPLPPTTQPPPSPLDEDINLRNEQRELAARWTGVRKKQATVRTTGVLLERQVGSSSSALKDLWILQLKHPFTTINPRFMGGTLHFTSGKLRISSGKLRFAASRLCFTSRRQRFGVEKKSSRNMRVKPISASDERTLDSAIAMVNEIAARSMEGNGHGDDSPKTPASPNKRKFSFRFPPSHNVTSHTRHASLSRSSHDERRNFTEEAASIPDMQTGLCRSLLSLPRTPPPSLDASVESLMMGSPTPLRLPLWDRASAEFYFARSRDLLTKCPPYGKGHGHLSRGRLYIERQNERGHLIRAGSVGSDVRSKNLSKNVSDGKISEHCDRVSLGSSPPIGTGSLSELIHKYGSPPKESGKIGKSLTELMQKYGSPPKDKSVKNGVPTRFSVGSPIKTFAAMYKGQRDNGMSHSNDYEKSTSLSKHRMSASVPKIHLSLAASEDSTDSMSSSEDEGISRRTRRSKFRRARPAAMASATAGSSDSSPDLASLRGVVADVVAGLWGGRSPPPPSSFLHSLSPPYPGNRAISETSSESENLDLSEYPEFARDFLTFPPSPAPSPTA